MLNRIIVLSSSLKCHFHITDVLIINLVLKASVALHCVRLALVTVYIEIINKSNK